MAASGSHRNFWLALRRLLGPRVLAKAQFRFRVVFRPGGQLAVQGFQVVEVLGPLLPNNSFKPNPHLGLVQVFGPGYILDSQPIRCGSA